MMRWRVVREVALTTFREFWRSPDAVFWTYGFPLMMAVVLGFAFQPAPLPPVPVAVVAGERAEELAASLRRSPRLAVEILSHEAADRALARGRVEAVVRQDKGAPIVRSDPVRQEAEVALLLVEKAMAAPALVPSGPIVTEVEDRPGSRYIDFLIPGLIGLNLLGAGMWGIGFRLVELRLQKLLRRLFVTPMRRSEFLLGFLFGRGVLMVPEAMATVFFGWLLWGVPLRGSLLAFVLLVAVGGFAFTGLGCLVASRARTMEGIMGLMNLVQLPMWLLGGVFFNTERLTGVVRWAAEVMPLTHLNHALRLVMLEPAGIGDVWVPILGLLGCGLLAFGAALRLFRWT